MYKYILKRILVLIPVIIGVSFLIFVMMDLAPGDIVDVIAEDYSLEDMAILRHELGLDRSVFYRYFRYMGNLLKGDMGFSYLNNMEVWKLYKQRFPNTLKLALASMFVCVVLSLPLGITAAKHRGSGIDNAAGVLSILGLSIPNFWLGLMLIILFAVKLQILPAFGADRGIISLILPAFTVGTGMMATMSRTTRSAMLDVLSQDYLRTARSQGVSEKVVVNKLALRNALIPIITVFGTQLGGSFGGALVTENVFTYPGIGQMIVKGIKNNDTNLVCGFLIMSVVMICVIQLIVDIMYAFVDPRLKSQYASSKKKKGAAK